MLFAPRTNLFAVNIFFFVVIFVVQQLVKIVCIFEEKACHVDTLCDERCAEAPPSGANKYKDFTLVPQSLRQTMRNFGYGEGHFQIFVEEKQRYQPAEAAASTANLNPH